MENLSGILTFARAAEARSFTKAARQLGISASGVSKAISRLEEEFGVRLLNRTSRSVTLTVEGRSLYDRCRRIVAELADAERELTDARVEPRGLLRVTLPLSVGRRHIARLLPGFSEAHPQVELDVSVSDRVVDIVAEGFDLAVRIGRPPDSRLVAKRWRTGKLVTCAAPRYLERHGTPRRPEDLARHQCARFVVPDLGMPKPWQFRRNGRRISLAVSGSLSCDHPESLVEAAIEGTAIIQVSSYITGAEEASGKLVRLLAAFEADAPPVYILFPQNRYLSPKARAFVDYLMRHGDPTVRPAASGPIARPLADLPRLGPQGRVK